MSRDWSEVSALDGYPGKRLHNDVHSCQRAIERYSQVLTDAEREAMVRQIQENRGVYLYRKSKMLSVWAVYWPKVDAIVPVYYDRKRGQIASVLPRASLRSPGQGGEE